MEHCGNYTCEIRHKCERYTGELHYTQSVRCFSYSKKKKSCNNFIENEKSKSNNELIEKGDAIDINDIPSSFYNWR